MDNNRRRRILDNAEKHYKTFRLVQLRVAEFPPVTVYLGLDNLAPILEDISTFPTNQLQISDAVDSALCQEILELVRNRREQVARLLANAYSELARDEERRNLDIRVEEEEENQEASPTTIIDQLPLTLPPLPPWLPLSNNEPILATDEQLTTFLDTSPLARRFECRECQKSFTSTVDLYWHFAQSEKCPWSRPDTDDSTDLDDFSDLDDLSDIDNSSDSGELINSSTRGVGNDDSDDASDDGSDNDLDDEDDVEVEEITPFWDQLADIQPLDDPETSPIRVDTKALSVLLRLEQAKHTNCTTRGYGQPSSDSSRTPL